MTAAPVVLGYLVILCLVLLGFKAAKRELGARRLP
jgi:hypothetical protein